MSSYSHYYSWVYSVPFWMSVFAVIAVTAIIYFVITTMISFIQKRVRKWAEGNNRPVLYSIFSDVLHRTSKPLILAISLLISLHFTALPDRLYNIISHAWFLILAIQVALWLDQVIQSWIKYVMNKPGENRNPVTLVITGLVIRGLIWSVMLLSILANAGVDITALIASLGVGGIAIALAVQTILSDVFASLSIGIDKPFEIGDLWFSIMSPARSNISV